jgi:hypothetical protein
MSLVAPVSITVEAAGIAGAWPVTAKQNGQRHGKPDAQRNGACIVAQGGDHFPNELHEVKCTRKGANS